MRLASAGVSCVARSASRRPERRADCLYGYERAASAWSEHSRAVMLCGHLLVPQVADAYFRRPPFKAFSASLAAACASVQLTSSIWSILRRHPSECSAVVLDQVWLSTYLSQVSCRPCLHHSWS